MPCWLRPTGSAVKAGACASRRCCESSTPDSPRPIARPSWGRAGERWWKRWLSPGRSEAQAMRLPVRWGPRDVPLPACGLMVRAAAAHALAGQLLQWSDARLSTLRGCVGDEALVVLGDEPALPWIDGACYL